MPSTGSSHPVSAPSHDNYQAPIGRTVHSERNVRLAKYVKREPLKPAVVHCIRTHYQTCFEKLENLQNSKLTAFHVLIFQETRFFQWRLPPRTPDLHSVYYLFCGWVCRCRKPLKRPHWRLKRIKSSFKKSTVKQHKKINHQFAVDFDGIHCDKVWNEIDEYEKKERKGECRIKGAIVGPMQQAV